MLLPLLLAATATAQYNNVRDPCPAPTQPRQCLALSVCLGKLKFFVKIAKPKLSSIPLARPFDSTAGAASTLATVTATYATSRLARSPRSNR